MTIFSQEALNNIVKTSLVNLPEEHKNAIVGTVDATGAQVVVGFSKDVTYGTWTASGAFRHDWSGDNSVGTSLMLSW